MCNLTIYSNAGSNPLLSASFSASGGERLLTMPHQRNATRSRSLATSSDVSQPSCLACVRVYTGGTGRNRVKKRWERGRLEVAVAVERERKPSFLWGPEARRDNRVATLFWHLTLPRLATGGSVIPGLSRSRGEPLLCSFPGRD